jgi:hypothetical protein
MDSVFFMSSGNIDIWDRYTLSVKRKDPKDIKLINLQSEGFCVEKQVDFYKKIKSFVPSKYHETLCPKPDDEQIAEVKKIKSDRSKRTQRKKNES